MIPYRPEPLTDFRSADAAAAFDEALARVQRQLGVETPLFVDGRRIMTERRIRSVNPSDRDETVGLSAQADAALAELALQSAGRAYADWSRRSALFRADILLKAAALLRRRKHEFSAWLLLEAGKSRGEADADTAEAIDFLEYYARQALQLEERAASGLVSLPGENNRLAYVPLGVGVIIAPWNFPLAILVGMTAAAIVTGNTAVVKPASATPIIAAKWTELLEEAGLPAGVVQLVPGSGDEIGDFLVAHPLTRFVSFTGSRDIGVRIAGLTAALSPGQKWLKRYVAEMGGKDGIVVDADADLELAAAGIVQSAFGYAGQKCSACSRAIVHEAVYDELLDRCVALTKALSVGDVRDPGHFMGPVIDERSQRKIAGYLAQAPQMGRVAAGGQLLAGNGFFVQPTIVADVAPASPLMQEEIFGPVLAFAKARDFSEALRIANDTDYGLTGSVYARSRDAIDKAREQFHVGNLYINRKCTGAVVGAHPFGGFNMSGTDSKAGGPDYLLLFTQLKLMSELL